jgi:hypothetical protein
VGRRACFVVLLIALVAAIGPAPAARADDPRRWLLTGASSVPLSYWQGLTSDPSEERVFFAGVFEGLWQTTPLLRQTAGVPAAIPPEVKAAEGYNHIGDPTWNPAEAGRVLLPLECFTPGVGNTCATGSFGVADPGTLGFRYYVKLDPAEIPKAMWAETSPDGGLVWTSSGADLLAYSSSDVSSFNAAPVAAPIRAVRRLAGAVPPSGITGAVFRRGRLFLAGETGAHQIWSVDTASGQRRLEFETELCGEAEGLDVIPTLGGRLQWLIAPFDPGCELTFGPTGALLHLVRRTGRDRLRVRVRSVAGPIESLTATVRVTRRGRAVRGARVSFAGYRGRTAKNGVARVAVRLELPGHFAALARKGHRYGLSGLTTVGDAPARSRIARNGAG